MNDQPAPVTTLGELLMALAEPAPLSEQVRKSAIEAALRTRSPGRSKLMPGHVPGTVAFKKAVEQMGHLLDELRADEWLLTALRDLSVQELLGHLTGAETAFASVLEGTAQMPGPDEHISSTLRTARDQAQRSPLVTYQSWRDAVRRTLDLVAGRDALAPAGYYGIVMPLDQLLVVRAFEMWTHHEDIRRATGRPPSGPEPAVLARMVDLAMSLLPGCFQNASSGPPKLVHLVLTGTAGGTWDISSGSCSDGAEQSRPTEAGAADAVVVVDTTMFCRVAANRTDLTGSQAVVRGDREVALGLFRAAASLALD